MADLRFTNLRRGLRPFDQEAADYLAELPIGALVAAKVTRPRNVDFHRKYFALLNYAFENWTPGEAHRKSFDVFRREVAVLAGFYDQVWKIDGAFTLEAKSISFAKMGQDEFEALYQRTVDVILEHVLDTHSQEDIERVINEMTGFW